MRTLQKLDALRRPERLDQFLIACEADARGRKGFEQQPYPQADYFKAARRAVAAVDTTALAGKASDQRMIPEIIFQARSRAIALARKQWLAREN